MMKAYFMRLELSWEGLSYLNKPISLYIAHARPADQHIFCTEQRDSKYEVKFNKLKE